MEMNAADQRSWYELAASRSVQHQMDGVNGGGGGGGGGGGNLLVAANNPTASGASGASADDVDMFFPSLDSTSNSRARYYQQVHHAAQMHSAYNTAASHGNLHICSMSYTVSRPRP